MNVNQEILHVMLGVGATQQEVLITKHHVLILEHVQLVLIQTQLILEIIVTQEIIFENAIVQLKALKQV